MKKFNKLLMLFMVLTLAAVLAACAGSESGSDSDADSDSPTKEPSKEEGTDTEEVGGSKELDLLVASEPPNLHPGLAEDTTSGLILQSTFEGLMTMVDGKAVESGAQSYEVSPDLLTYTFTLREDAKWSNGEAVTANDYAYAWKWALDPVNASGYASILYAIKGAEAFNLGLEGGSVDALGINVVSDNVIEVTLEVPTPYFLELTAFKTMYPIHQATQESNATWHTDASTFVSNGPFKLTEWVHQGSLTLEKSDQYWDASSVAVDKVNIAMVESESTQMNMYDAGEVDFIGTSYGAIALDSIERLKKEGTLKIADYTGIYWYKTNTTDKIMKNVNIRKALALSINRTELIKNITKGEQQPALGIVPNGVPGFGDDAGYFKDADIEAAKEYLAKGLDELGLSDPSKLTIKLSYNTSEAHAAIAQFIQQGWKTNLGINTELDNAEWQVYLDKLDNFDYQVGRLGWIADYNDAYTFLEMFNTAANGNNDTGWENAKYTEILKKSVVEQDAAKRTQLLLDAEAIIMEEMPVMPIYFYTNLYIKKDYITGMEPDALGNINLKYADTSK